MKFLSENFKNLRALYINQIRSLLSAEEQMIRALPNMVVQATDTQLRQAIQSHLQETEVHVKRLEDVLAGAKRLDPSIGPINPIKCKALHALVEEADDMMLDARDACVRDAALIAAAQRIEHYEIAAYGTVRHFARTLGESNAAETFDKTIKEEGSADHILTSIAERINVEAKKTAA
jgi:ferritin-like metal-binding protein YciE